MGDLGSSQLPVLPDTKWVPSSPLRATWNQQNGSLSKENGLPAPRNVRFRVYGWEGSVPFPNDSKKKVSLKKQTYPLLTAIVCGAEKVTNSNTKQNSEHKHPGNGWELHGSCAHAVGGPVGHVGPEALVAAGFHGEDAVGVPVVQRQPHLPQSGAEWSGVR